MIDELKVNEKFVRSFCSNMSHKSKEVFQTSSIRDSHTENEEFKTRFYSLYPVYLKQSLNRIIILYLPRKLNTLNNDFIQYLPSTSKQKLEISHYDERSYG
jgi:hypothetical protein